MDKDFKKIEKTMEKSTMHKYATSLGEMIKRVEEEPKLQMVYSGIKENSVGLLFGPSKSGKTMFCENLGMCIAANANSYLGNPIQIDNKKVLFFSFEEHYTNRTERNTKQALKIAEKHGYDWLNSNYIVLNENLPRYIITDAHWQLLEDIIQEFKPGIVFFDSLTHMVKGKIEDSMVAIDVMKRLKELSDNTKTTIGAIHHTHKLYGQALSIDTIAGSRAIAQESDFMIGINRTMDGKRYIKDVAFRYAPCDSEQVRTFDIDKNCWLNITGEIDEIKLLAAPDGRRDDANKDKLFNFITENEGNGNITTNIIEKRFIATGEMSKQTVFTNLKKLEAESKIIKPSKGEYKIAA